MTKEIYFETKVSLKTTKVLERYRELVEKSLDVPVAASSLTDDYYDQLISRYGAVLLTLDERARQAQAIIVRPEMQRTNG